jgi:hypothetical protein
MFIKKRIGIYALYIYSIKSPRLKSVSEVLYFRTKADAIYYQKSHYKNTDSDVKELDAIEEQGEIKHFHYKPSAAKHTFGAYLLDDNLRMEIVKQDEWVLVGLNRPHPNKRIAGSPSSYKEVRHFIWAGKLKNELVIKDAKLLNKPIVFTDQRSLNSFV